VKTKTH